jgi:hypothetical protein
MGTVHQLKKHGVGPDWHNAFGVCCSFHPAGSYTLVEVHCRFTGELPCSISVYVRDPASVLIKKIKDRSKEHGEIVFLVVADPPLQYVHLVHTPIPDVGERIMCLLTEDLGIQFDEKPHCILEWDGQVDTPWTLFDTVSS